MHLPVVNLDPGQSLLRMVSNKTTSHLPLVEQLKRRGKTVTVASKTSLVEVTIRMRKSIVSY